jgi:hypothetical protein
MKLLVIEDDARDRRMIKTVAADRAAARPFEVCISSLSLYSQATIHFSETKIALAERGIRSAEIVDFHQFSHNTGRKIIWPQ